VDAQSDHCYKKPAAVAGLKHSQSVRIYSLMAHAQPKIDPLGLMKPMKPMNKRLIKLIWAKYHVPSYLDKAIDLSRFKRFDHE